MKVRGKSIQRENTRQCKIDYSQSEEAPTRADFSIGAIASAAAVSVFERFFTHRLQAWIKVVDSYVVLIFYVFYRLSEGASQDN